VVRARSGGESGDHRAKSLQIETGATGLEPATSGVTGRADAYDPGRPKTPKGA
jgi:hypothetical protein